MNAIATYESVKATISTTNRRLENFLYSVGIKFVRSYQQWDMMTAWEYENTQEFRAAVKLYQRLYKAKREADATKNGGEVR